MYCALVDAYTYLCIYIHTCLHIWSCMYVCTFAYGYRYACEVMCVSMSTSICVQASSPSHSLLSPTHLDMRPGQRVPRPGLAAARVRRGRGTPRPGTPEDSAPDGDYNENQTMKATTRIIRLLVWLFLLL